MYFVTGDIHSYFSIFKRALEEKGFDIKNPEHKLIICGDLFDRGSEAKELLNFLLSLPEDRLIIVKGNHEDLFESCLFQLEQKINISSYHWYNGTIDTISQLTGVNKYDLMCGCYNYSKDIKPKLKRYFKLLKRAVNYYEFNDYIFVHGWIPLLPNPNSGVLAKDYDYKTQWKDGNWEDARWLNGMECAINGKILPDKKIVCGHWHCSWGWWKKYPDKYNEMDRFDIFEDTGIVALDACTAYSRRCNIFVI